MLSATCLAGEVYREVLYVDEHRIDLENRRVGAFENSLVKNIYECTNTALFFARQAGILSRVATAAALYLSVNVNIAAEGERAMAVSRSGPCWWHI